MCFFQNGRRCIQSTVAIQLSFILQILMCGKKYFRLLEIDDEFQTSTNAFADDLEI